jgi:pimeloyl-ACP methyl ester carboxylesterase
MPFYERGDVRIYYEEAGSGFPLLLIPGGGLSSTISFFTSNAPFNAIEEFKGEYRCITADLRNARGGQSTGPLEVERPWEAYADDQLGLMDHLGIKEFMVMGFCIGGPFALKLIQRAPERVVAAVCSQPVGHRPELPDHMYNGGIENWAPALLAQQPDLTQKDIEAYLHNMFRVQPDFVYTVSRDFARSCQTPVLVMPDDTPGHPLPVAKDIAALMPNAEVTAYPWREPRELYEQTMQQVHAFLRAHQPVAAAR